MDAQHMVQTVERYFAAVDRKDLDGVLAFFVPDAVFTVATYDTVYRGRDTEISGMFDRLFKRYAGVWHGEFSHVVQPPALVATRFRVRNTTETGEQIHKSNCNFFRFNGELFDDVRVYMSGDNALR
jgi:ketosteroid isomerase-like protein